MSDLLTIEEWDDGYHFGYRVVDPLGKVSHSDSAVDAPEDMTCDRHMEQWINEVNRLRTLLSEVGRQRNGLESLVLQHCLPEHEILEALGVPEDQWR